jgi:CDP-diacylglycerol--serine O-phosphatidyltransferase
MLHKRQVAPNLVTIFNLFLGFAAIVSSTKGNFETAAWLIIIAAVCDVLDGKIARATRGYSEFGVELDSLADVVSFGAAPAAMIYLAQLNHLGLLGLVISFTQLAAGAIRLARFNTRTDGFAKSRFYEGMPIPSGAMLMASYVLFSYHYWDVVRLPGLTVSLVLMTSILMVSTIEFDALPQFSFRHGRRNTVQMLFVVACMALILIYRGKVFFPLALFFIFIQLARAIVNHLREQDDEEPLPDVSVSKQ